VRRKTVTTNIGQIPLGSDHPVVVQSMTNTDTSDVSTTVSQIKALAVAGSELVRVTVNNDDAAKAVPLIVENLDKQNIHVPIVGDFHYNGHLLLTRFPECAKSLAKYRINPGNVGTKTRDKNFTTIVEQAIAYNKPVRIGVNWGSLDKQILTDMMDANSILPHPLPARDVTINAMVESALRSALLAEDVGIAHNMIILSAKVSGVLVGVVRRRTSYCIKNSVAS
jgi:(E)-4-hydroxy-3-methylbut-2-enyl-diphosphate synthase